MLHLAKQFGLCALGILILCAALELSHSIGAFTEALHDNTVKVAAMDSCRMELSQLMPRGK